MVKKILFLLLILLAAVNFSFNSNSPEGNTIQIFSEDGAWCWFSDPRAVYHKGDHERTYAGYVTSTGDITISYYDHQTGEKKEVVIYPELQRDDHVNPSLLFLPDGRLMAFFTRHNGGFYFTRTKSSEDITEWEDVGYLDLGPRLCYTNPAMLSAEDNRIYVYLRGGYDWKPTMIYSDDLGETWSKPLTMVAHEGAPDSNRPYTKVVSDGRSKVWFAITDGHPNVEPLNSIYVFYYEDNHLYQVDGTLLGHIDDCPILQSSIMKAYDGEQNKARCWIWDLAVDDRGFPRITYASLREETMHLYYYASWNGVSWQQTRITPAGQDFPREERTKEQRNREPFYSGGVVLDPEKEGIVYYSRPVGDRFEIFKGELSDGKWEETPITQGSEFDNVRPFVARYSRSGNYPRLFWMANRMYQHWATYDTFLLMDLSGH